MKTSEILHKLQNARRNSNGWLALCPSHDDTKQSLSVKEADGKILLKCFAGCDVPNIVSALGIELKDLFSEPMKTMTNNNFQSKKIVGVYPYADENGELLYENVRFEPKDFRQRRFDESGKEIWNLKDVRRVPYRLPELVEGLKEAAEIWLCEGEKDADNLRKLGFTVSSFKNWKPEFNHFVKNFDVVLFIDHDIAGLKQANDAAQILSGSVASLKLVDLFSNEPLPEKHGADISDFINLCAENEDLSADEISERLCIYAENADVWQQCEETNSETGTADFQSLFTIQDANIWLANAKLRPVPKMLFGEFWFEGELCISFADTGKGKSILAVQIGNSISKGESIGVFALETLKQKVLYFDFELSDKQFEARYSTRQGDYFINHYVFDENFKRGEINQESFTPAGFLDFEEYLFHSLEIEIIRTGAKVLIVDNITYLKNATETAKDAMPLMKALITLKKKYLLSILALAHTPKRDLSRPLTVNDLQGSKMLSNFADSIFAIGESAKDKNLRYLKQIKARNTEEIYHAEYVATCQITKPDNFLMFEFLNFGSEREHLKVLSDTDKADLIQQVKNLSAQGKSQRIIAAEIGIPLTSVNRYVNSK